MQQIFKEIVKTLQYIHSKGYLHNDLKANNVLVHREGMEEFRPIIIDFGKSKEISKVEGHKYRVDASYLAPEVKLDLKESEASDIFSFGKMLEAAVLGRSFRSFFSVTIAKTTASSPSKRPTVNELLKLLA